ncbi:hypothetical protein EVAR_31019_1 [Eumeta japonica]|uniref:Uncharacterized protein n=1 Tax=Eumeta variegata TaxID=151549 RepID=A0A4C1VDU0_EUMVA|nr:hypothetical protein EVAR_31019_1 [Eumeta japonica]
MRSARRVCTISRYYVRYDDELFHFRLFVENSRRSCRCCNVGLLQRCVGGAICLHLKIPNFHEKTQSLPCVTSEAKGGVYIHSKHLYVCDSCNRRALQSEYRSALQSPFNFDSCRFLLGESKSLSITAVTLSAYAISLQSFSNGSRSMSSSNRFHSIGSETDLCEYPIVVIFHPTPGANEQAKLSVREVVHHYRIDVRRPASLLELDPYHRPPGVIECARVVQEHQLHILPGRGANRNQHCGQYGYSGPPLRKAVLTL